MNYPVKTYKEPWKNAYVAANKRWYELNRPVVYAAGHWFVPAFPPTNTANGLTKFILNFLTWNGHRATRINSSGRIIKAPQRQTSGISLLTAKYIPGTTRRGAADLSSTIAGRSVMWEVKIGSDKPSEYQLREQQLEEAAGGKYFFVKTPEDVLERYNSLF